MTFTNLQSWTPRTTWSPSPGSSAPCSLSSCLRSRWSTWHISEESNGWQKSRLTLLSQRWWMPSIFPTTSEASCLTSICRRLAQDKFVICWNPQIRLATSGINLGVLEKGQFQLNTVGTLVKLIYAFLWQVDSSSKVVAFYYFWKSKNLLLFNWLFIFSYLQSPVTTLISQTVKD